MIRIEAEQFDGLRQQINHMLNVALQDMIQADGLTETVTAKIKITLETRAVPLTPTETRIAKIPEFAFKVSNSKQIKRETEGELYEDQMEIFMDDHGELEYRKIPTGQMSLFDEE